jgi:septum formation protein
MGPARRESALIPSDTIPADDEPNRNGCFFGIWNAMRLILASASPRRRDLLRRVGIEFTSAPVDVDERARADEAPEVHTLRLAREKARAAARGLGGDGTLVLGADTVVADGARILGKPADAAQAREFLQSLRGREHRVITGICLLDTASGRAGTDLAVTRVRMRAYAPEELEAYLVTGDGLDKAGAYAIQHALFRPVESIDGCYANVVGLPVCRVYALLEAAGAPPAQPLPEGCRTRAACAFAEQW